MWHLTVAERKQFKSFHYKILQLQMAQKTSINQLFFIATDWETDLSTNTITTGKNEGENDDNKLDIVGVIPDEICLKIFSYLDVKSLCRSLQTCWKWRGFIEGSTSLWRAHYRIYKCLVPSMPYKRRNSDSHWKTELQKLYQIYKLMRRWSAGEFSFPKSEDEALPGSHIQELPAEVWGTILENELKRKQPHAIRTQ